MTKMKPGIEITVNSLFVTFSPMEISLYCFVYKYFIDEAMLTLFNFEGCQAKVARYRTAFCLNGFMLTFIRKIFLFLTILYKVYEF